MHAKSAVWRVLCEECDTREAGLMLERVIAGLEDLEAEDKFCPTGCSDCPGAFRVTKWDIPALIHAIWLTFTQRPAKLSASCLAQVGVGRFGYFANVAFNCGPAKIAWHMLEVGRQNLLLPPLMACETQAKTNVINVMAVQDSSCWAVDSSKSCMLHPVRLVHVAKLFSCSCHKITNGPTGP